MLVKIFSAPSTGDTPVSLSQCGEYSFQVALGGPVGYHIEDSKEVIRIGVYLEGVHEFIYIIVGRFLGADVCIHLADIGTVRELIGKVTKLLAFESLDLAKVPRLLLSIVGVCFATGWSVVIFLCNMDPPSSRLS